MTKVDTRVGAVSTYLDKLQSIESGVGKVLYFRGRSKITYELVPSIFRDRGWINNEDRMLKELILRCPNDFSGGLSAFQCLVKMQHYSLPTRLLDITSNPLVALFNACKLHEKEDEDGEVVIWGFDIEDIKYYDSDTVSVISNLSRRPRTFKVPSFTGDGDEAAQLKSFNDDKEIKLLLHDIRQEKPHFKSEIRPEHLGAVLCVKPLLDNPRIIRQDGAFLLFGCDEEKTKPAALGDRNIVQRIRIDKAKKPELLRQLEKIGISEATLYPEIERVAIHIKSSFKSATSKLEKLSKLQREIFDSIQENGSMSSFEISVSKNISVMSARHAITALEKLGVLERTGTKQAMRWQVKRMSAEAKGD